MTVHRLIAVTLCAAAFACGSDEISGVANTGEPAVQPDAVVLYGYVAVDADMVRLQAVIGSSAVVVLVGPLVDELRNLDGAFVIVRGTFTGEALEMPTVTVESYELIEAEGAAA